MEHSKVVLGALLVAGGDAAELLQAVEEPLHPIARPIGLPVEAAALGLIALGGDHRPDAAAAQVSPRGPARIGLVARYTPGPQAGAAPLAADRAGIEQGGKGRAVVALAPAQGEGDRPAMALGSDVDLGREPTAASPERLVRDPPFSPTRRAPAAC